MTIKTHKLLDINYLKQFCSDILADTNHNSIKEKQRFLLKFYSIINFKLVASPDKLVFRARKCDDIGFDNIVEMGPPPVHLTKSNRLNEANKPVLYLSNNMWSSFDEIGMKDNDYVQVISCKYNKMKDPSIAIIGDIKEVFRWGNSRYSKFITDYIKRTFYDLGKQNLDGLKSYIYTDSFLSSLLTDSSAKDKNYIHTQSLSELIFEKLPHVDGVAYQGIESSGAWNLALKSKSFKEFLSVNSVHLFHINQCYGYGIYGQQLIKKATRITDSGKIVWK